MQNYDDINDLFFDSKSPHGPLLLASCQSGTKLAARVFDLLMSADNFRFDVDEPIFLKDIDFQFSDGETCVRLEKDVNGRDVFLFQGLKDPTSNRNVDENYMAFLIAVRTFKEWGANRVVGVLPYLAYARQDKPTVGKREPVTAELMADLSVKSGIDRLIVWAPHDKRVHGYYGKVPVDDIDPLPFYEDIFQKFKDQKDVMGVAPDAGAANMMISFSRNLGIRCAITSKHRPRPEKANVTDIIGNFDGIKRVLILDDMINTGGTIKAAVEKVVENIEVNEIWLGVSHFLGSTLAIERMIDLNKNYGLQSVYVTDSVPTTQTFNNLNFTRVFSIDKPLMKAIINSHFNRPIKKIFD